LATTVNLNLLDSERSLKNQLKGKSWRRRDGLARLAAPGAAPRALRNDVLPALTISYEPLNDLRSPQRKLRKIDPAHVREVAGSISELGFCNPILVGTNNVVLSGQIRLEAAKLLGLDRAPCIRIGHLSESEQRLLRIAVNRLGEKGEWDLEELKIELEELDQVDAPLEITGFSQDERDHIMIGDQLEAVERGPLGPDPAIIAVARAGDMFRLGSHRLICGDARDPAVLRLLMHLREPAARLVLTDEPYNVPIAGHVTRGPHSEFAMASGEMSAAKGRAASQRHELSAIGASR
jgi:hypothetical protein